MTSRTDRHAYPIKPGDNRMDVEYFATRGALLTSVTVDGKTSTVASGIERGHPVFTVDLELPHGQSRTVTMHLTEPAGHGAPVVLRQPLVRPLSVSLDNASCN